MVKIDLYYVIENFRTVDPEFYKSLFRECEPSQVEKEQPIFSVPIDNGKSIRCGISLILSQHCVLTNRQNRFFFRSLASAFFYAQEPIATGYIVRRT